jgi:HlyD family secretion protein
VKVDAFGDQEIEAEVTQKTPLAVGKSQTTGGLSTNINVQEAKEFRVVLQLQNLTPEVQQGLRPGMSATLPSRRRLRRAFLAVPLQAIVEKKPENTPEPGAQPVPRRRLTNQNRSRVFIVLDGNKAKFKPVETGITGESDIQITSGLSEGRRGHYRPEPRAKYSERRRDR